MRSSPPKGRRRGKGVGVDIRLVAAARQGGPYGKPKELFSGFWILDVASQHEAVEWAKRAAGGAGHDPGDQLNSTFNVA